MKLLFWVSIFDELNLVICSLHTQGENFPLRNGVHKPHRRGGGVNWFAIQFENEVAALNSQFGPKAVWLYVKYADALDGVAR